MASEQEYGVSLRARIDPLITGVGPVEGAIKLTQRLTQLQETGDLPQLVISLGSAGSAKLAQTHIYQVATVSYRDMDASPLGFAKGCTPFLDLPATLPLPLRLPGLPAASLSTGGAVISGAAYEDIDADMVDMETFALLRACQLYDVPLIGLRGISDGVRELTKITDWTEYLHVIDAGLAAAVDDLFMALETGALRIGNRPQRERSYRTAAA